MIKYKYASCKPTLKTQVKTKLDVCADFPTGVEDRAPEDRSRKKCRTFSFVVPGDLDSLTLTFELGRYFCRMHLTAKFHRSTFNLSDYRVDKQTKQTN